MSVSAEIVVLSAAKTGVKNMFHRLHWLGFHTFDVEMAVDNLKEIYKKKCKATSLL